MIFSFSPMQESSMNYLIVSETELEKAMHKTLTHFDEDELVE